MKKKLLFLIFSFSIAFAQAKTIRVTVGVGGFQINGAKTTMIKVDSSDVITIKPTVNSNDNNKFSFLIRPDITGKDSFLVGLTTVEFNLSTVISDNGMSPGKIMTISLVPSNSSAAGAQPTTLKISCPDRIIKVRDITSKHISGNTSVANGDKQPTGIAYYDAITLSTLKNNPEDEEISRSILSFYKGRQLDIANIENEFSTNIFIQKHVQKFNHKPREKSVENSDNATGELQGTAIKDVISGVGGLDVTNIADGVAKFIVKRTKQELSSAFFDKFKETMDKDEFKDLRSVFPNTYQVFCAIGEDIYDYEAYMQTLRESFEKDIKTLPANLPRIIDNHEAYFNQNKELRATLLSGFYLAEKIEDHAHPGDIIAGYNDDYLNDLDSNFKAGMQTIQILSASLKKKDDEKKYWLDFAEVKKLFNNAEQLQLYLGLLIEEFKAQQVTFVIGGKRIPVDSAINSAADSAMLYKEFILGFAQKASAIEKNLGTLKNKGGDSVMIENYYNFFNATVDVMKYAENIDKLPGLRTVKIKGKTDTYLNTGLLIANVAIDVNRKKYGAAIVDVVSVYNVIKKWKKPVEKTAPPVVTSTLSKTELKSSRAALRAYKKDPSPANLSELRRLVNSPGTPKQIPTPAENSLDTFVGNSAAIFKYGTLIATISQAKSSDDVENAIEAFALPAGSSRVKRESIFNVSFNAYAGLYYGYEKIQGVATDKRFTSLSQANSYGITAPIGIAVSFGKFSNFLIPDGKGHWSHSIFVSLVDIGAVAAFRFQSANDSVKQIPSIQLKSILSPGVFWSIGIPKCPLSCNLGAQLGPNLRKVESTVNDYSNNMYWRYSVSVCVDLPVLNLYTKPTK